MPIKFTKILDRYIKTEVSFHNGEIILSLWLIRNTHQLRNGKENDKHVKCQKLSNRTFAFSAHDLQRSKKIFETSELQKFSDWAKDNQRKLNPSKCQALEVCFKNGAPLHADIMIGTEKLPYVNKAIVLGLWLQCGLKWASQVDRMSKK